MYVQRNVVKDGWSNALGGVDSGRASNLIQQNQHAFAVNVTMRGGHADTRPPFVKPALTFDADGIDAWWADNETQGADYFAPVAKNPLLVVAIGGRLYKIDVLDDFRVTEITPVSQTDAITSFISPPQGTTITVTVTNADLIRLDMPVTIGDGSYTVMAKSNNVLTLRNDTATPGLSIVAPTPLVFLSTNPRNRPQVWMEQADKWLVIQDGQSAAIFYDGATVARSDAGLQQVPTGTVMVWNEEIGRLAVALPDNKVAIGDILDPLKFTENTYLAEGGEFQIPRKFGRITGACMLANQDRANGQGAMLFFTKQGITAFNLPPNRATWKQLNYPVQINMPIKGAESDDSITNVNGDAFYRAMDGMRSFALTRQEFGQWGNTPVSRELSRILDDDNHKLLRFASSVLFDNRLLFTVTPQPGRYAAYHKGLGVLDFDGVSAMGQRARPRYDGVWTGIQPTHLVTGLFNGDERCFAFTRGINGGVELWEILQKGDFDGDDGRITSFIESRGMDFQSPFELKELADFEMWIDNVFGTVDFTLEHKADLGPCWNPWDTKQVCQTDKVCPEPDEECKTVTTFRKGQRSRLAFGQPPDTDASTDNRPNRLGYIHEIRLEWTGRARVKWAITKATRIPEDANPTVETVES